MSKPIFAILRALIALVIGFLLAFNPEEATKIIVILIGVLFLLIGIVSVVYNVKAVRSVSATGQAISTQYPLTSVGCILFGLVLALMPAAFIKVSMFILGAFLVLAGAFQIVNFRLCSKTVKTPMAFYVISAIVMLAGIFIFVNPIESAALPVIVLGTSFLVYGVMEAVLSIQGYMAVCRIKKAEKAAAQAEEAAAAADSETTTEYITFDKENEAQQ